MERETKYTTTFRRLIAFDEERKTPVLRSIEDK